MEQQKQRHYSPQEDEDEEEVGALQGRQSRHRNNSPSPASAPAPAPPLLAVFSTHNGNREVEKAKLEAVGYDLATELAEEEDKKGISTGEVPVETRYSTGVEYSKTSEEWNVTAIDKSDDIQTSLNVEVSQQNVEEIGNGSPYEETKVISFEEHVENKNGSVEFMEEIDVEETEYDVERVIEKQNTHDLVCPNCKNCITRTVILRRRKRPWTIPPRKPKPGTPPGKEDPPAPTSPAVGHEEAEPDEETAREVLSCLACFKFFIPKGLTRGSNIDPSVPKQEPGNNSSAAPKPNWFIYYFFPSRSKEEGKVISSVKHHNIVQIPRNQAVISPKQDEKPDEDANMVEEEKDFEAKPQEGGLESNEAIGGDAVAVAVADSILPVPTKPIGSSSIAKNQSIPKQEPEKISTEAEPNWFISMLSSVLIFKKKEGSNVKHSEGGLESLSPPLLATEHKPAVADSIVPAPPGDHVVVDVGPPAVGPGTAEGPERREVREWDVMKSLVYGGLVESITSLGVVSSAAAAGATTLNIFAMGLANLISGLFILGHNLRELKNEKSEEAANQLNEQKGRYQEVLGRGNFSVHATLAVISYLVFGLLPPVIYGFSFRQSGNRDYKLAAVLGASLICIALLAIAKSYVRKPPKSYFKTLSYYLSTGAVTACVAYLVGVFIKKLMERLGWLESSSSSIATISLMGTKSMQPTWASY